jgi:hypothetical protein
MVSKKLSRLFGGFLILTCFSMIIVSLSTNLLSKADNTVLFSDDFETGNLSKWNDRNGNPTVSTTYKHSGNYACRGQYSFYEPVYVFPSSQNEVYLEVWHRYTALPYAVEGSYVETGALVVGNPFISTDAEVIANSGIFYNNGAYKWVFLYEDSKTGGRLFITSPTPAPNTWFKLSLYAKVDSVNGTYAFSVNDANTQIITGVNNAIFNNKFGTHGIDRFAVAYGEGRNFAGEVWADDVVVYNYFALSQPVPTATPTAAPTPTATPTPTVTPIPTPTPAATPTPTSKPLTSAVEIESNATNVTAFQLTTAGKLSVSITKNGGLNSVEATISKTTLPNITSLTFYINNVKRTYTYTSTPNSWIVTANLT